MNSNVPLEKQENAILPTPERLRRGVFRTEGTAVRAVSTVLWLYKTGDIGDDEVAASQRWRAEYEYAELGVIERVGSGRSSSEKGDVHTWMLSRGRCAERLRSIRQTLGLSLYTRIEMIMVREMSFAEMARLIFPLGPRAQARTKTAGQCALALERLSELYKNKY